MTHAEFFPYHNYHIRFRLNDGKELSGVLVDIRGHTNPTNPTLPDTVYQYIPTIHMIEWKQAEQRNDKEKMKSLEGEIDIKNIVWAERMKY